MTFKDITRSEAGHNKLYTECYLPTSSGLTKSLP